MGIEKLNTIWPDWRVSDKIGEGAEGKIYRAVKKGALTEYSAVKVINVPENDAEIISLKNEGMDSAQIAKYYNDKVTEIVDKAKLNISLSGAPNTVTVQDCKVLRKTEGIGWEIFIRTELLIPLNAYLSCNSMSEADVIKLGIDLANSLEHSEKKNVLHRDIKPNCIYLSSSGDFKLGDYNPASDCGGGNYTSPEAVKGEYYGAHSDVYSIGIILYTLLNNNRLPFTDPDKTDVNFAERSEAARRRFSGEDLPPPCNASKEMANVVALACSYDPAKRFKTAAALKAALQSVAPLAGAPMIRPDYEKTVGVNSVPVSVAAVESSNNRFSVEDKEEISKPVIKKKKDNNKKVLMIVLISVAAVLLVAGIIIAVILAGGNDKSKEPNSRSDEIIAALTDGNYSDALDIFKESGSDKELVEGLTKRLDKLYKDFLGEKVTYDRAKLELETIEAMNIAEINEKFISTRDKIYQLNDSRVAFDKAEELYANGDYIKAIESYLLVIKDDPNYSEAQKKISSSKGEYRELVIEECEALESEDKYIDAIDLLENALKVLENDSELEEKLKAVKTSYEKYIIGEANALLEEKKYEDAEKLLEEALEVLPGNEDIEALIADIPKQMEEDYIEEAEALASKGAYDSAIELLTKALEKLPENENILAKIEEIKEAQPVDLTSLTVVDSTEDSVDGIKASGTDAFGDSYKTGISFSATADDSAYVVYDLGGEYKTFKATVTLPKGADSESEFTVEIYADGKRIKRVKGYQMSEGSMALNLKVEDKEELEIRVTLTEGEADSIYVVDCVLSKN